MPLDFTLGRPLPAGLGYISQWFGEHPEWYKRWGLAGHNGIDYAAPIGTPVLAAITGVCDTGNDPDGYGIWVTVSDGLRLTRYAHLSRTLVRDGQLVQRGEKLGEVGDTGNSTGPHLHFALRWARGVNPAYGHYVDPHPFRE
jgi:murein DD-endopeptidase MepM/ murein hydrolase activator NlpD